MAFDLGSYVDVATRMAELAEKYPDASLQPADLEHPYRIETIGAQTFVVYVAACYRTPDDPRPGIGSAWEPFPGKTSYTRDSELQNAETSAFGRAIVAALAATTKGGVASQDEVRNRRRDQDMAPNIPPGVDPEAIDEVKSTVEALSPDQRERFTTWKADQGFPYPWPTEACTAMLSELARIISADAVDLAAAPCARCGSTRARRALAAGGEVRCTNTKDCDERAAALLESDAPFAEVDGG